MSDAILLVDDEPSVLSAILRSLRGEDYEVLSELSGELALERMSERPFKVVVSDERMASKSALEFAGGCEKDCVSYSQLREYSCRMANMLISKKLKRKTVQGGMV